MGKFVSKKQRRTNKNKEKRRRSSKKLKKNTTRKMRKIGGKPPPSIDTNNIEAVQDEILSVLDRINKQQIDYYDNKELQKLDDKIIRKVTIDGVERIISEEQNTSKLLGQGEYRKDQNINSYKFNINLFIKYTFLLRINAITQLVYDILKIEKEEYEYRIMFSDGRHKYGNSEYYGHTSWEEVDTFKKISKIIKRIKEMKDEEMTNLVTKLNLNNFNATNLGYFINFVYVPDEPQIDKLREITLNLFEWATKKADEAWEKAKSEYIGCYITDVINVKNYKTAIKEYKKEIEEIYSYEKFKPYKSIYIRKYLVCNDMPYKGKINCDSITDITGIASYIQTDNQDVEEDDEDK